MHPEKIFTMEKHYNFKEVENKLYDFWEKNGFFFADVDEQKTPFVIVIPPPNVTGVLHMGHMLNNTLQDVLIRRKRMEGYNACWVPGTDHASIATEAKVVKWIKQEKNLNKSDISRDEFLEYAWQWTKKHGGIILQQLRKLGASCDWRRTTFTLDEHYYKSVIKVFCELYREGLIYKGKRMINWDPVGLTALSDEEVIHKETNGNLYYVKYPLKDSDGFITIATTRPETILADTAVAVNPNEKKKKNLVGKTAVIPIVNREVPIIADDYIDPEFGTGALKVTPANDPNDYEIGLRHNLPVVEILNPEGTLNENALHYQGKDRFVVRKEIVEELKQLGLQEKIEPIKHKVGHSERTDAVVEPMLSEQWFVKMKPLAEKALQVVEEGEVSIIPKRFIGVYKHWMENIRDWCISRQLWWGHRIPAYYLPDGRVVVGETKEIAYNEAKKLGFNGSIDELKQDEDVLDTWFSSWLWPIAVFNGILDPENPDFKYFYPTDVLITAPEILFFWVARMIMAGLHFTGKKPFHTVYLHGIVRDKLRRKMSKSLGNSPDPLKLIEKYSADGVRMGMLLSAPAGNDLLFDEKLCEQGRNFTNKIWNALRLVKIIETKTSEEAEQKEYEKITIEWMENFLILKALEIEELINKYNFSEAIKKLYSAIWDDFFSWFLEIMKPAQEINRQSYDKIVSLFEQWLMLLHPFMPFITEEVWQNLRPRKKEEALIVAQLPDFNKNYDEKIIAEFEAVKKVITILRDFVRKYKISKDTSIKIVTKNKQLAEKYVSVIGRFANIDIQFAEEFPERSLNFVVYAIDSSGNRIQEYEFAIVVADLNINFEEEYKKLDKELKRLTKFLSGIEKKLNNPKFIERAKPEIVEKERQKYEGTKHKIRSLQEQMNKIENLL